MVKYIKPKPLSKRELKDIQRSPNLNSPQMQALSPAMPFPNSPFLDDNGCSLVESPSKDKVRKQRSGTMKAARERILPRARKSGGRHKPIAIPSTPSPPRTPIIPSDTDSGCESEFTAMINSAKNRIRQSADKMREDGSKLHKLKASSTGDSLLDEATKSDQYLSPGRKRRVNLLRKKASGSPCISRSPSIAVSGSGSSPVFSISFGDPSSSFEVLLHSSASSSSQLAAPTPRTFVRSKANTRGQNTRTLGTTSGPNKGMPFDESGQVTLTLRSFTAADMVKYGMSGLGLSATNVLEMTFEPDSATKESKEVPAEGTENRGEAKKKPKSKKKKKKRARSRAVSVCGSPALPANLVAEQEPSASRGTSPKPKLSAHPCCPDSERHWYEVEGKLSQSQARESRHQ
ncbi:hypothetical protein QCA50_001944 [Cerrena zonata]|uniref:Uncharacterized protein n=1 Tax=Cerrena zonata TaxID=2478898 RepID=A0AAW0GY54_9APHY